MMNGSINIINKIICKKTKMGKILAKNKEGIQTPLKLTQEAIKY